MTNEQFLELEVDWLVNLVVCRLKIHFKQETAVTDIYELKPPETSGEDGAYSHFIVSNRLGFDDRVYLAMMVSPILRPQIMDCFNVKNANTDQRFLEYGCVEPASGGNAGPSLETVLFILAGTDVKRKLELMRYFSGHRLFCGGLFLREETSDPFNYRLLPSREFIDRFLLDRRFTPEFSTSFPARRVHTERSWDELVLEPETETQLEDIKLWLKHGDALMNDWGMKGKFRNGYRALFFGPPGTGKTFTATLLGSLTGKDVYCVDLSAVVSKYIGETEKNLNRIFSLAEDKDWILFFDEADSLFGKRTGIKDSHDRYANQEVAYLLQRIEDYSGLVILSTNLKTNVDEAFTRRFQSVVRFPVPGPVARERLWRETFPSNAVLDGDVDLKALAAKYELSGGSILNVAQYCSLHSLGRGENIIRRNDILDGIRREYRKEGKIVD